MATATGNPLLVGGGLPGWTWVAPLATAEPTSCSSALPSAYKALGYTQGGGGKVTFTYTNEKTFVDQLLDPVRSTQTQREGTFQFSMAESTIGRLNYRFGTDVLVDDTAVTFEPPDIQVESMLVWDSMATPDATNIRWLFRRCFPNGTIELDNQKGAAVKLIPVSLDLLRPDATTKPFKFWANNLGQV